MPLRCLKAEVTSDLLNEGPAIRCEIQPIDAERRYSVVVAVVVVIDKRGYRCGAVCAGICEDALTARPDNVAVRAKQDRAAIIGKVLAAAIYKGPGGTSGASIDDAVGAGGAAAGVD